eukprot:4701698-Amphidinium_carterae.1
MAAFAKHVQWTTFSGEGSLCFWHSARLILQDAGHPHAALEPELLKQEVLQYGIEHASTLAKELGSNVDTPSHKQQLWPQRKLASHSHTHKYGVSPAIAETQHSMVGSFWRPMPRTV